MVQVKICGITNRADGLAAARLGADLVGLVLAPSPRRVTPEQARKIVLALPPGVKCVGVFVDAPLAQVRELRDYCGLDLVQLHGAESEPEAASLGPGVIKALRVSRVALRLVSPKSVAKREISPDTRTAQNLRTRKASKRTAGVEPD